MKTRITSILLLAGLFLLVACSSPEQVLQNEQSRQQLYESIASDREMMQEFMNVAMSDQHAPMMHDMMMADSTRMMHMMQNQPQMRQFMMSGMMRDSQMMGHMMEMMHQQGMMADECWQAFQQRMHGQGMHMQHH